ncbi:MAG: hypothetical protein KC561_12730, partial [Myxococcales bacterium]|nr:hypothetical protein [Myxococcales bacterium]
MTRSHRLMRWPSAFLASSLLACTTTPQSVPSGDSSDTVGDQLGTADGAPDSGADSGSGWPDPDL